MAATLEKPASVKQPEKPAEAESRLAQQPKKKRSLKMILIFGAFGFFAFTLIIVTVFKGGPSQPAAPTTPQVQLPTPTTPPRPSITPFPLGKASVYAADPQILQLEGALKNFERQLEGVDLREPDIDPPDLMMDVNFRIR